MYTFVLNKILNKCFIQIKYIYIYIKDLFIYIYNINLYLSEFKDIIIYNRACMHE